MKKEEREEEEKYGTEGRDYEEMIKIKIDFVSVEQKEKMFYMQTYCGGNVVLTR